MQLISRQEAKAQGYLKYYTGKPCKHGHLSERFVSTWTCCACKTERAQTPEVKAKQAARMAAHYKKNADKIAATNAAWRKANPHTQAAISAQRPCRVLPTHAAGRRPMATKEHEERYCTLLQKTFKVLTLHGNLTIYYNQATSLNS